MADQIAPGESGASLDWHVEYIVGLARLLRPAVYVELGIYEAELFNKVAPHAGQAIGVDVDPASADHVRGAPNVRFVRGTTDSFVAEIRELALQIDLLFIDADHSRESVLRDFRNYFPFVRPHGLILLHDTHPGDVHLLDPKWCGDACLAIEELQEDAAGYEMMTIPRSPGLTMCRKRTTQLAWMEPPATEVEDSAVRTPREGASHFRIVCIVQVFNEIRKGNLERFFENTTQLVDEIVVYDDGSTDGSYEYSLTCTPHVIRGSRNDFAGELAHKHRLLERARTLAPDYILWLDADEVLATEDPADLQRLCAWNAARDLDGTELHEVNLWRSHSWKRLDSLFDEGWFVRLWRVTPDLRFATTDAGLHQAQFPASIQHVDRYPNLDVLHFGFADWRNLAHKYLVYRAHGQRGYDMLDRLVSEEQLVLERVPDQAIPRDLRVADAKPTPLSFPQSLAQVERLRDDVLRPGFSIVCLVYKSVEWARFVYEQVLRYTDMADKEFFFVANDASSDVLDYLRANYIPHFEFTNTEEQRAEWYINNVYRAYNYGARKARGDLLIFINTDMAFSPGWCDALWDAYDGASAVASRLVESGKLKSGQHGIEMNFGTTAFEYQEEDFLEYAEGIREPAVLDGGLFMPLLIRRDAFLAAGGYPEGNIRPDCDIFDPEMTRPGEPCVSGDNVLIQRLRHQGVRHRTACDSVVYHFQMGEMDAAVEESTASGPLVAICNDLVTGTMGERVLWDVLLEGLPSSVGIDGRLVGSQGQYSTLARAYLREHHPGVAVIIQNATFIDTVDPERHTIAFLQDDLRAMGRDSSQQERNLSAARTAVTNSLLTALSYPEWDFEIIPVGVDADLFRPMHKTECRAMHGLGSERIGIFVGAFDEVKGWPAVQRCVGTFPEITWLLVTKKDEFFEAPNVRVFCRIPQDTLATLLNSADFFILGSAVETQCLAAIEACLCNVPVVMRNTGIFSELTDEQRQRAGVFGDDLVAGVDAVEQGAFSPRDLVLAQGWTTSDAVAKWRLLIERAVREVIAERVGFVGSRTVDVCGAVVRRERTRPPSTYLPVPTGSLRQEQEAEHASNLVLEEQAERLRRGVEGVFGARLADPALHAIHLVSWVVRPLRSRLARTRGIRSTRPKD